MGSVLGSSPWVQSLVTSFDKMRVSLPQPAINKILSIVDVVMLVVCCPPP